MSRENAGATLESIKEANVSAVLNEIVNNSGISRIDIARKTGISCALATKILSKLVNEGVVSEEKIAVTERGRPKVALSFNSNRYAIVGLRINIKYISSVLCSANGKILCHNFLPLTDDMKYTDVYEKCCDLINKSIEYSDGRKLLGIGIAAPGPLPIEHNRITALKDKIFKGFSEIEITKELENYFKTPVVMWHDAHCGAFNEYIFGESNTRYDNIVFIATDSGLGAGIIIDGKPYSGGSGLAGEVSQMIICKDGDFYRAGQPVSQSALIRECGVSSIEEVIELVKSGDENSCRMFNEYITNLSVVIANFISTISPEAIFVSDKIAELSDRILNTCNKFLNDNLPDDYYRRTKIIVSPYGKHSVLRGACGAVLCEALSKPCKFFSI